MFILTLSSAATIPAMTGSWSWPSLNSMDTGRSCSCFVYTGSKISLVLLALLFAGFVGIFTDVDGGYLFFCTLPAASLCSVTVNCLKGQKRRRAIQLEFPDFVNKLTLLVNAGLTVSKHGESRKGLSTSDSAL